jgi:hypothetical protein
MGVNKGRDLLKDLEKRHGHLRLDCGPFRPNHRENSGTSVFLEERFLKDFCLPQKAPHFKGLTCSDLPQASCKANCV